MTTFSRTLREDQLVDQIIIRAGRVPNLLHAMSRDNLREIARAHRVPTGRDKCDTVRNLVQACVNITVDVRVRG